MNQIILASASPRRKELLKQIGLSFVIEVAKGEEVIHSEEPGQIVMDLSGQKAAEVADRHKKEEVTVIGADTIVVQDGHILGKPKDEEEAYAMLSALSGRDHAVYTGVTCILQKKKGEDVSRETRSFYECTRVTFYEMTGKEIRDYIASREPMDKAGAYGIQGIGAKFIKKIDGDYNTVVGLPLARVYQELLKDMQ